MQAGDGVTCIVGLARNGAVYLGADSLGADVSTYAVEIRKDPKIFRNGDFIIGYTTSFRMGDLLRYSFTPPTIGEDLSRYMRTSFVDELRKVFKDGGFAKKDSDRESGGEFLVGVRDRLFAVESDYQVSELLDGWHAIGSGMQIARGALHALIASNESISAEAALRFALEAATYCSAYVRGPYHFLSTEVHSQ